ncbi:MAG: ArnT family glycosyltransferase [Bacteriovoracia bacterium]
MKKITNLVFLIVIIVSAYLPFMNFRVLRMAGDEKVYISQAIEMARDGRWFVQTLADEPNYFKGPLHYILIRIGMIFFGNNLFSALWMNLLFVLICGITMFQLGARRWGEKSGLILGFAAALNVGLYSHSYVSQMEIELTAFYCLAAWILSIGEYKSSWSVKQFNKHNFKWDLLFWVLAGISGWSKSPLYSVFIGISGITYWALTGQLMIRARSYKSWLAAITGVLIGFAGYLPVYLLDKEHFVAFYLYRENISKPNTNRPWHYVMIPLTYFLFPWTFIVLSGIIEAVKKKFRDTDTLFLGLAIAIPSILFWCFWSYKGQNYNLPNMIGLVIAALALHNGEPPKWVFSVTGVIGLIASMAFVYVMIHFWPLPSWWDPFWVALALVSLFSFSFLFLKTTKLDLETVKHLGIGAMLFFVAFAAIIVPTGQREMIDARKFIKEHPGVTYHYYNLDPSIWSEWGILELTLKEKMIGLHRKEQLEEATKPGHVIFVMQDEWVNNVLDFAKTHKRSAPEIYTWKRWLTKGRLPDGTSRWSSAWYGRDLTQLERDFKILYFK